MFLNKLLNANTGAGAAGFTLLEVTPTVEGVDFWAKIAVAIVTIAFQVINFKKSKNK